MIVGSALYLPRNRIYPVTGISPRHDGIVHHKDAAVTPGMHSRLTKEHQVSDILICVPNWARS
jgi:hypothetical protein